jgi:hypothetical protein
MRHTILEFQPRLSLVGAKEEPCRHQASQFERAELTSRLDGRNQLLTPALAGAETPGSFAALYAPNDCGVSVPGKLWSKRRQHPYDLSKLVVAVIEELGLL